MENVKSYISELLSFLPLLQAFFFAVLFIILLKKTNSGKYIFLYMGFTFLCFASETLANFMVYDISVISYYVSIPLQIATIPFLYFYFVRLTNQDFDFKRIHYLHFLPALMLLIFNLIVFSLVPSDIRVGVVEGSLKTTDVGYMLLLYADVYNFIQSVGYNIQVIIYSAFIIYMLIRHKKHIKDYFSYREKITLSWVPFLIVLILISALSEIDAYYADLKQLDPDFYAFLSFFFIGSLGYFAIWQGDIYRKSQFVNVPVPIVEKPKVEVIAVVETIVEKEIEDALPEKEITEYGEKLHHLMIEEKPYINSKLTLDDLAGQMNIHKNLLSKVINTHFNMNFFHFVNKYRIEAAKEMLTSDQYNHLSIEGIAQSVGFNSKSVFYPAFKKEMNLTPSEYRKGKLNTKEQ